MSRETFLAEVMRDTIAAQGGELADSCLNYWVAVKTLKFTYQNFEKHNLLYILYPSYGSLH